MRRRAHPVHIRDLDWYKYMRRYVWDDETTPYLVPVPRLHRRQADNEIMLYSLFVCLLFGAVALISTTEAAPYGRSFSASLYGFLTWRPLSASSCTRWRPSSVPRWPCWIGSSWWHSHSSGPAMPSGCWR